MVSFGGSFRGSRFSKKSLNTSKVRGAGSRIGNSNSRFGGVAYLIKSKLS